MNESDRLITVFCKSVVEELFVDDEDPAVRVYVVRQGDSIAARIFPCPKEVWRMCRGNETAYILESLGLSSASGAIAQGTSVVTQHASGKTAVTVNGEVVRKHALRRVVFGREHAFSRKLRPWACQLRDERVFFSNAIIRDMKVKLRSLVLDEIVTLRRRGEFAGYPTRLRHELVGVAQGDVRMRVGARTEQIAFPNPTFRMFDAFWAQLLPQVFHVLYTEQFWLAAVKLHSEMPMLSWLAMSQFAENV